MEGHGIVGACGSLHFRIQGFVQHFQENRQDRQRDVWVRVAGLPHERCLDGRSRPFPHFQIVTR